VDDDAIKKVGVKRFTDQDAESVAWLDPSDDQSATSLESEREKTKR
jgi:hypothetical protein